MSDSPELAAIRARDAGYERCDDWAKASADRRALLRMLDRSNRMIAALWNVLANDDELFSMACAAVDEVRDE